MSASRAFLFSLTSSFAGNRASYIASTVVPRDRRVCVCVLVLCVHQVPVVHIDALEAPMVEERRSQDVAAVLPVGGKEDAAFYTNLHQREETLLRRINESSAQSSKRIVPFCECASVIFTDADRSPVVRHPRGPLFPFFFAFTQTPVQLNLQAC